VRLPGRESRSKEPLATHADSVVEAVIEDLERLDPVRTVFYGHSMGAALAHQTAHCLRERGRALPVLLIASGRLPPHLPYPGGWGHRSDEELWGHVVEMGGIPRELYESKEYRAIYLRRIRADFLLNDTLWHHRVPPVDFPITIINGVEDPLVHTAGLAEWKDYTRATFKSFPLAGGHFFFQCDFESFIDVVVREIEMVTSQR
jgi:coronamic acid synthetase CmaT thioesterase component